MTIDPSIYRQLADLEERLRRLETMEVGAFVGARYTTNTAQTFINNTAAIVNYEDMVSDPLGLVTTGAGWFFSCPTPGCYRVTASILFDAITTWAAGEPARLDIWRNGAPYSYIDWRDFLTGGTNQYMWLSGSDDVFDCVAGDALQVLAIQVSGVNIPLYSASIAAIYNHISIARIG